MIDYVKMSVVNLACSKLEHNPLLDFKAKVSTITGEVNENHKIAEYNSLKFEIINQTYIKLSGSLHKYWRNGSNYCNYNFNDFANTVIDLYTKFNINPCFAKLENIEFGVNIFNPPIDPTRLTKLVINHKGVPFSKMRSYNMSLGVDCYHQQYSIKIYDKSKQYKLNDKVLRYEIKAKKMVFLKKERIVYLADLLSSDKFAALGSKLVNSLDNILINDDKISLEDIKPFERLILSEGRNPKFWEELKVKRPKTHDYKRRRFRELLKKYSKYNLQEELKTLITEKYNLLAISKPALLVRLSAFKIELFNQKSLAKLTTYSKEFKKDNFSQINCSSSKLNCRIQSIENAAILFSKAKTITKVIKEFRNSTCLPFKEKITNKCKTCNTIISDYPKALYCSEKCRDDFELWRVVQKLDLNYSTT